jgi:hypothetical protein
LVKARHGRGRPTPADAFARREHAAARANDLLLGPGSGQQLINDVIRELAAQIIRHVSKDL